MQITVNWDREVTQRFPQLQICIGEISNLCNENSNSEIQKLRSNVREEVRAKFKIETLKDEHTVRAYRDFYWKLNVDPTKTRPSGEALLRRVLHGDELPQISTAVDAYNLVSMQTMIPISGFDADLLEQSFHVRFARTDESFVGIGMTQPIMLKDNALVLADEKRILCIYPYRDSDYSKITLQTRNGLIVAYGAPGITETLLRNTVETTLSYIKQTSQGDPKPAKIFSATCKEI